MKRSCWFRELPGAGPCDGRLVRCHLIPRQVLRREIDPAEALDADPGHAMRKMRLAVAAAEDPRGWVWGCGGPTGIGGHHGRLDSRGCNPLRIPRHRLPEGLEEFAAELGLEWWLDREYGERVAADA